MLDPKSPNVLIVEDSDTKFDAIAEVVRGVVPRAALIRAPTMIDAERLVGEGSWWLVVLDISMDIAPSSLGPRSRGQANIGGLGIAQRMFLLEQEAPTIVVTAFDSFSASTMGHGLTEIVGFDEVRTRAEQFLSNNLIACLQYSSPSWREEMKACLLRMIDS